MTNERTPRWVIVSEELIVTDDELKAYLERETRCSFEDFYEGLEYLEAQRLQETLCDIVPIEDFLKEEIGPDTPRYKVWLLAKESYRPPSEAASAE